MLREARGKIAGLRALGDGKMEVSLQGKDALLGSEIEDVTFWSVMRANGTVYGHGNSLHMSSEGTAEWHGSGVGRPTGLGAWKYVYGGAYTNATPQKWQRLVMFIPAANMKKTLTEISTGNSNGNTDISRR